MKALNRFVLIIVAGISGPVLAQERSESTASALQDNSFLIEEAYNQEPGVVQHILNTALSVNHHAGNSETRWDTTFTQEWPIGSETHQFSYTAPVSFIDGDHGSESGVGDLFLNYRLQVLTETDQRPAFSPRFSLILPTGDETRGFGNGVVGYQGNLPVSKIVSDRWTLHGNLGATFLPDVEGHDLFNYNVGGSAIYAVSRELNLMLECVSFCNEEAARSGRRRDCAAILLPGFRYAFNFKNGTQIVGGIGAPIGLTSAAPDYGVFLYFSVEHFFARPLKR